MNKSIISKKNYVNILVVILVFSLLLTISYRFGIQEENTFTFSGPNIYRSVFVYQLMYNRGYLVNLEVEGKWIDTEEPIHATGLIVQSERGQFRIILDDHIYKVGGPSSATEDIAANRLRLLPLHESVVKVHFNPVHSDSLGDLLSDLTDLSESILPKDEIYSVGVIGEVLIDVEESLKPSIIQDISNILNPDNSIALFEHGIRLFLRSGADLSDLEELQDIFKSKGLTITSVATGEMELDIRSISLVDENQLAFLESTKDSDFDIFQITVINEPLK